MAERGRALLEWRPRLTARARLALTLAGMLAAAGALVIAGIYAWLRLGVSYTFPSGGAVADGVPETVAGQDGSIVAVRVSSQQDFYDTLLLTSMAALGLIIVLGAVVAWSAAGRMLRPLKAITAAARRASRGKLDHRIGLQGPRDEFSELAETFDGMLDRLERSFHAHRRFAANASHELRTPLATTKAILDVADVDGVDHPTELIGRLRDTNRRSIEIVEALLDLSDIDNAEAAADAVMLDEVVAQALDAFAPIAEEQGLQLTARLDPVVAAGDETLLQRLSANLLDNAIRHNVVGGFVGVETASDDEWAVVVVRNSADASVRLDLDKLVEPFHRSRGRASGRNAGHGLGLAIVQSIVAAHGGRLAVETEGGTVVVSAKLPRFRAEPAGGNDDDSTPR